MSLNSQLSFVQQPPGAGLEEAAKNCHSGDRLRCIIFDRTLCNVCPLAPNKETSTKGSALLLASALLKELAVGILTSNNLRGPLLYELYVHVHMYVCIYIYMYIYMYIYIMSCVLVVLRTG